MSIFIKVNGKPPMLLLQSYASNRHKDYTNIRFIYESSRFKLNTSSKWRALLPLGVLTGICYLGYKFFSYERKDIKIASKWQVNMYRLLPLRATSRLLGRISEIALPPVFMRPMLKLYVWAFNCRMHEAIIEDVTEYGTFGEFFRRELKSGIRIIDGDHLITSPADGTVLHFGRIIDGSIEQVKGIDFTLDQFLGPPQIDDCLHSTHPYVHKSMQSDHNSNETLLQRFTAKESHHEQAAKMEKQPGYHGVTVQPGNDLFFCTVYLAPGDYHRFHSPASWIVEHRRHFPGDLLSVSPGITRWIQGLFNYNERAIYYGTWANGFFALAAIGATNVGSIRIYCDADLVTNRPRLSTQQTYYDKVMCGEDCILLKKGEIFGEFNLGSSLVIIFEAPEDFTFTIHQGQKVKVGEPIGTVK